MFALPLYVYSLLAAVGVALLVYASAAGRLESLGEPLGGSFRVSNVSRSLMLTMGTALVLAAVIFGFQTLATSIEGLLVFLGR